MKITKATKNIDLYQKSREKLERILSDSGENQIAPSDDAIRQAETELEQAFSTLLTCKPETAMDILVKSRALIEEVVSGAELAQYQVKGLKSILVDLANFAKKV